MMKRILFAAAVAATMAAAPAFAQINVSVNIGQPGYYGRIDLGNVPQPQLIYAQPVIIQRTSVQQQPVYLHVPPGHEKKWSKHCSKYNACGQRVYFVQNGWYNNVYVPSYRERGDGHGDRQDRDDARGDNGKHGRGDDNGHGNGHGKDKKDKGHGKGHKD